MKKKCRLCIFSRVYKNEKNKMAINHKIDKCSIKECISVMKEYTSPRVSSILGRKNDI